MQMMAGVSFIQKPTRKDTCGKVRKFSEYAAKRRAGQIRKDGTNAFAAKCPSGKHWHIYAHHPKRRPIVVGIT